jgi:hypothetical protein
MIQPHQPSLAILLLSVAVVASTGCTLLDQTSLPFTSAESSPYHGLDGELQPQVSMSEQIYHSVRRARVENAVVLQVDGGGGRILPLPADRQSVYVSNLLKQAGVIKRLGRIEVTLYRHSPEAIGGIRMAVTMSKDGKTVRPETDYALQAGDRVLVQKSSSPLFQGLLGISMGD